MEESTSTFILSGKCLKDHPEAKLYIGNLNSAVRMLRQVSVQESLHGPRQPGAYYDKSLSQAYSLLHMTVLSYNNLPSLLIFHIEITL